MALGATQRDVLVMVHKSALTLVAAGLALGAPLALTAHRVAVTFVDNAGASTTLPIAAAAAAMIAVAVLAVHIPARRASRVNPTDALRAE